MAREADFDEGGHFAYGWIGVIKRSRAVLLHECGGVQVEQVSYLTLNEGCELLG